jgi:hypothetical protein
MPLLTLVRVACGAWRLIPRKCGRAVRVSVRTFRMRLWFAALRLREPIVEALSPIRNVNCGWLNCGWVRRRGIVKSVVESVVKNGNVNWIFALKATYALPSPILLGALLQSMSSLLVFLKGGIQHKKLNIKTFSGRAMNLKLMLVKFGNG